MEEAIRSRDGVPLVAPSVAFELLRPGPGASQVAAHLRDGTLDALLFLSPEGARQLVDFMRPVVAETELRESLSRVCIAARGPKTMRALEDVGLPAAVTSAPPHRWRDLLSALARARTLAGASVAVVEHGVLHLPLRQGLLEEGAEAIELSLYRWVIPEDTEPLRAVLAQLEQVAAFLFTNGAQVDSVFSLAESLDRRSALMTALTSRLVAAIGPATAERLSAFGVEVNLVAPEGTITSLVEATAARLAFPGPHAL